MYKYTHGMYIYTRLRGMYIYTLLMYKYTSYYRENVFVQNDQKVCEKKLRNCVFCPKTGRLGRGRPVKK